MNDGSIEADTLRVPFWRWDSAFTDHIPLLAQCTEPSNVLFGDRPYAPVPSAWADSDALADMFQEKSFCSAQSKIGYPHVKIHLAFRPAIMGDLMKAADDPLFFSHHSEVDRLFETWKLVNGEAAADGTASFFDADGKLGCYRLADFLDIAKLGYAYQDYPLPDGTTLLSVPQKIVLELGGLLNPLPNQWAFYIDREPALGEAFTKQGFLGYGIPFEGMVEMTGTVPAGTSLEYLLRDSPPMRVWAAVVTDAGEVRRVDEVRYFAIEQNLPDGAATTK